MKKNILLKDMFLVLLLLFAFGPLAAQREISGKVTDSQSGEPLIGVNLLILGTLQGVVTDIDGRFLLTTEQNPPFDLQVSYVGYVSRTIRVASVGEPLDIRLEEGLMFGEEIVVSASRRAEKALSAPASVSVLSNRMIEGSPQTDVVRNLINVPGVQIQQQSANRINIEMRASSGLFSTFVLPIMDYRSLVGPGTGTFHTDAVGISNIDIERIEIVRGPGSALYGPGVTSGVVHFITKNPIDHPGLTVQVGGGGFSPTQIVTSEQENNFAVNTFLSAARYAWANPKKTFGFKINAFYNQGAEFTLDGREGTRDPVTGQFTTRLAEFKPQIIHPAVTNGMVDLTRPGEVLLTLDELDPDGDGNMMADDWFSASVNTTLEFRPQDDMSLFLSGGYNQASTVFYNDLGEGLAQQAEFWGQGRLQKGGLFAQVFYVNNNGGSKDRPSFLYTTGNRSPIGRQQLEGQLQYNFELPSLLNAAVTVGADYRLTLSESYHLVYGRNEDRDDYQIMGGYAQAKFALGDKVDLIAAGRYDDFNFLKDDFFSPRVALVYKPNPRHTLRATFNRAGTGPDAIEMFVDFPVNAPIPGAFDFWLSNMGEQQTFGDNPNMEFVNQYVIAQIAGLDPSDPKIAGLLDLLPDELPWGTPGLPLALGYGVLSPDVIPLIVAGLSQDPNAAPLAEAIGQYLAGYSPAGFTGSFAGFNAFDGFTPLNQLIGTKAPSIITSNTFEVGYKGVIRDKLSVALDVYNVTRTGFSDFTQIAPLINLQDADLANDLGAAVAADLTAYLTTNFGLPLANAQTLGALVGGAYSQAAVVSGVDQLLPGLYNTATVESSSVPQGDGITHVAAGYRIFPDARLNYWGVDLGLEYFFTEHFSVFGNYSWISQNEFDQKDLDEPADSPLTFSLNTPQHKFRIGLIYAPASGWRGNLSFQYDESFYSNAGSFAGQADEKHLVDASFGYKFKNGLALDLSATNLFNQEYRAFPNMPVIGRRVITKLTYHIGQGK